MSTLPHEPYVVLCAADGRAPGQNCSSCFIIYSKAYRYVFAGAAPRLSCVEPVAVPVACALGGTDRDCCRLWDISYRRAAPRACHVPCARRDALAQTTIYEKVCLFLVHLRPTSGPLRTQVNRNPPRAAPPSDRHGRPCLDWTGRHPPRARPARSPHAVQCSCGLYGGAR